MRCYALMLSEYADIISPYIILPHITSTLLAQTPSLTRDSTPGGCLEGYRPYIYHWVCMTVIVVVICEYSVKLYIEIYKCHMCYSDRVTTLTGKQLPYWLVWSRSANRTHRKHIHHSREIHKYSYCTYTYIYIRGIPFTFTHSSSPSASPRPSSPICLYIPLIVIYVP